MTPAAIVLSGVVKDFRGLRPLRVERLSIVTGESTALVGFDAPMAEVLINLVTGFMLPDAGTVEIFGRPTSEVTDSTEWLAFVDRFGIVSERAPLLDQLSVIQNLAMPFGLDIEPPPDDVRERAEALAREVGLADEAWDRPVADLDGMGRMQVRLGRGLALDPAVLLLEHPTIGVPGNRVEELGRSIRSLANARSLAALTLTADDAFAHAVAPRVLELRPASGRLAPRRRGGWLRGLLDR